MECDLSRVEKKLFMDSKTLATILIVITCLLLFPVFIGIIGGVFGLLGGIFGAIFGAIGGIFGAFFAVIGAIFGAVFGFLGWLFDIDHYGFGPFHMFDNDVFAVVVLIVVIVLLARSRSRQHTRK